MQIWTEKSSKITPPERGSVTKIKNCKTELSLLDRTTRVSTCLMFYSNFPLIDDIIENMFDYVEDFSLHLHISSQKALSDHFTSKQIPPLGFAEQYYKCVIFPVRGPPLDVRIWRLKAVPAMTGLMTRYSIPLLLNLSIRLFM